MHDIEWAYDNDIKRDPLLLYSAFTEHGARNIAKVLASKLSMELLDGPMQREDGLWIIMVTNPFYVE